jgi:hypothetical protein
MKLNTIPMTAQIPSGFGMPMCGHAAAVQATSFPRSTAAFGTTSVVRERVAAGAVITGDAKGDLGLRAYVPGTSAWSPPVS